MQLKSLINYLFENISGEKYLDEAALRGFSLDILKKQLARGDERRGESKLDIDLIERVVVSSATGMMGWSFGKQLGKEFREWLESKSNINISNINRLYDGQEIKTWLETLPLINDYVNDAAGYAMAGSDQDFVQIMADRLTQLLVGALKSATNRQDENSDSNLIINLIKQYGLPRLGKGSSRIVYALSTSKVIKVAYNDPALRPGAGIAQNKAEETVWKNPATRHIGARVYEIDPEGRWAVMEVAKVYKNEEQLKLDLGYPKILASSTAYSIPRAVSDFHKIYNEDMSIEQLLASKRSTFMTPLRPELAEAYRQFWERSPAGMLALVELMYEAPEELQLGAGDIHYEHFGKTADGRSVLIDYGFTTGVDEKYYRV